MASKGTDPAIKTYHCLCTNLLLTSTATIPSLPIRSNSLDKAIILPLPSSPQEDIGFTGLHHATLLSVSASSKPQVITKSDGFEKRWLQRCGRCRIVVGYQLDWTHWGAEAGDKHGRREDVIYLLPGGLMDTKEMLAGKDMASEVRLGVE